MIDPKVAGYAVAPPADAICVRPQLIRFSLRFSLVDNPYPKLILEMTALEKHLIVV